MIIFLKTGSERTEKFPLSCELWVATNSSNTTETFLSVPVLRKVFLSGNQPLVWTIGEKGLVWTGLKELKGHSVKRDFKKNMIENQFEAVFTRYRTNLDAV